MHVSRFAIPVIALLTLLPFVSGALALALGISVGLFFPNPYQSFTKKWVPHLLGISITGLGAGMNLAVIIQAGTEGIGYTIASIVLVMGAGLLLGKLLSVPQDTSLLICAGTAICGGSAIAAVSAATGVKAEKTSVALAVVFVLNALALVIFPPLGLFAQLSQAQFGLWSALAIHDTSSVVGAALKYGPRALEVASTIKLTRALWIAPLVLVIQFFIAGRDHGKKGKIYFPWFIGTFILAAALVSYFPALQPWGQTLSQIAKRIFVMTLFLIGTHISKEALKAVGWRPLAQGFLLWIFTAAFALFFIIYLKPNMQ